MIKYVNLILMQTERQTQIMESALGLIAEKGIQGLTIKNLSKKIGISEPAIYRHFDSKSSILLTILNNFKQMASMMSQMVLTFDGTAFEKIEFIFSKIIQLFIESPSYVSVIFSEEIFKNDIELKNKIIEVFDQNEQTIESIMRSGQEKGDVRSDIGSKNLALIVMGSLRFLVKQWDIKGKKHNLKLEGDQMLKSLKLIISNN
ncbi:MAG: TetR/AcrR family transcriptional regulator [Bacteroidetes bacterium]|nr:MAG: TetR/AcrR family transcriptional regulator [Bacteroidota bacterium]